MAIGAVAGWVMAGAAVAGTAYSVYAGEKSRKAQSAAASKQEALAREQLDMEKGAIATQEAALVKEQAAIAKQEALIASKQKDADKVAEERKARMAQNELLSGSETGTTGTTGTLLS